MESRLTFNIRCESADEFGEAHRDFTEAADWPRIPFLLPGDYPGRQRICMGRVPPTRSSALYAPASDASIPFSTPVGELGASPDRRSREGSGIRFPALCQLSHCFFVSFRPVAMGVLFIPLSPWIRVHTDDGETVADPCD